MHNVEGADQLPENIVWNLTFRDLTSPGLLAGFPTSAAVTPYILYVQFEQEFTNMGSDWCLEQ